MRLSKKDCPPPGAESLLWILNILNKHDTATVISGIGDDVDWCIFFKNSYSLAGNRVPWGAFTTVHENRVGRVIDHALEWHEERVIVPFSF